MSLFENSESNGLVQNPKVDLDVGDIARDVWRDLQQAHPQTAEHLSSRAVSLLDRGGDNRLSQLDFDRDNDGKIEFGDIFATIKDVDSKGLTRTAGEARQGEYTVAQFLKDFDHDGDIEISDIFKSVKAVKGEDEKDDGGGGILGFGKKLIGGAFKAIGGVVETVVGEIKEHAEPLLTAAGGAVGTIFGNRQVGAAIGARIGDVIDGNA